VGAPEHAPFRYKRSLEHFLPLRVLPLAAERQGQIARTPQRVLTVAFGYLIYHVGLMGLHAPLRLVGGRDKLRNRPLPNLVAGFGVHGLFALQFMRYLTANNYWSVVHKLVF
jgi:hypothetical protein